MTTKWTKETILDKLDNSEEMVKRSLLRLYAEQTADEQAMGATTEHNGFGFNGVDAEFMSSVAMFLTEKGYLSQKQVAWTRKKIRKYAGQLTTLANSELQLEEGNKHASQTISSNGSNIRWLQFRRGTIEFPILWG